MASLEDGGIGASSACSSELESLSEEIVKFKRFMDLFKSAEAMAEMESVRVRDSLQQIWTF